MSSGWARQPECRISPFHVYRAYHSAGATERDPLTFDTAPITSSPRPATRDCLPPGTPSLPFCSPPFRCRNYPYHYQGATHRGSHAHLPDSRLPPCPQEARPYVDATCRWQCGLSSPQRRSSAASAASPPLNRHWTGGNWNSLRPLFPGVAEHPPLCSVLSAARPPSPEASPAPSSVVDARWMLLVVPDASPR